MTNAHARPARLGRRIISTSALTVALAGIAAGAAALPAAAAGTPTPAPVLVSVAPDGTRVTVADNAPPAPAPPTTAPGGRPASPVPSLITRAPGGTLPVQPRGGVDTGLGGTQRPAGRGAETAVPLAAGGVGIGALAGYGVWRRRRAGAQG